MHSAIGAAVSAVLPGDLGRVGLGVLTAFIPFGLVDEVVSATGRTQRRVRRLPARVGVYFVLALALFSQMAYREVWRQLTASLPGLGAAPSRSALCQARGRLGPAPFRLLFQRVRGVCGAEDAPGVFFAGLRVVAWDGTRFDVPDSPANAARFSRARGGRGTQSGYPFVRVLTLMECGTHALIDAAVGGRSEQQMAMQVIGSLRAGMLLLADRNFLGFSLWSAARAAGADLLWRAAVNKRPVPVAGGVLPDGSYLAILAQPAAAARRRDLARAKRFAGHDFGPPEGILVRVIEYTITVTTDIDGHPISRSEHVVLVTSLLDPARADAAALAGLYHQRWEAENSYKELKVTQRGSGVILRSRDPEGIEQELWAYLVTYQAMRQLMAQAAGTEVIDTHRLSFIAVIRVVRRCIVTAMQQTCYATAEIISEAGTGRRARTSPRTRKRPQSIFPSTKRQPGQKASHPATYMITISDHQLPATP